MHGLELVAKCGGVPRVGMQQAPAKVEERDVVVTRNGQHRNAKAIQERPRITELTAAGALRDVA